MEDKSQTEWTNKLERDGWMVDEQEMAFNPFGF